MQTIKVLLVISITFLIFNAKAQNNHTKMNKNIILEYSDGNGNYYKITIDSIQYEPVTPQMSSSGIYSGGHRQETKITEESFKQILNEFEIIFKNTSLHIPHRIKTSGRLIINKNNTPKKEVIIKNSPELDNLEHTLKKLLE